jgi:hypothetical protein
MTELTPRRPRESDVTALVGMLALVEGEMRLRSPSAEDTFTDLMIRVGERFVREGLLGSEPSTKELATAIGNLNQRLRYVLGEYDDEHEGQTL